MQRIRPPQAETGGLLRVALFILERAKETCPPPPSPPPPRIIITFCEGDMTGGTRPWSTGSLTLDFLAPKKYTA